MQKLTLISIFLVFIFLAPLQLIAAQETTDQFNLKIVNVETEPDAIRVGEETQFIVSYANSGPLPVPPNSANIFLAVVDLNADENKVLEICMPADFKEDEIPVTANNTDPQKFIFPDCKFTPTEVGALSIQAGFVPPEIEKSAIVEALAAEDFNLPITGNTNQDLPTSLTVNVQPYESNLPDDLARVFAGLGIFFAIMAIVAVGTEVVIDTFKVALGFKSKVTATEGLEKMEKYMPGQLASLGVSPEQLAQFKTTAADMRATLSSYLKPVEDLTAAKSSIQAGEFKDAYTKIVNLTPEIKTAVDKKTAQGKLEAEEKIAEARAQMITLVDVIFTKVNQVFKIQPTKLAPLQESLKAQINAWGTDSENAEDLDVFLDKVFKEIRSFEEIEWSAELDEQESWLENQLDTFKLGSKQLLYQYNQQVAPLLVGIGFARGDVNSIQDQIAERLSWIETNARTASETYVQSVRNVINAVEQRRFQTQSPARKLWRALRSWEWGIFWPEGRKEKTISYILFAILLVMTLSFIWIVPGVGGNNRGGIFVGIYFVILIGSGIAFWKLKRNQVKLSIHGLYGVFALSVLLALLAWIIIWFIQPSNKNVGLFGDLTYQGITLSWLGWTFIAFSIFFVTIIFLGEFLGRYAFQELAKKQKADVAPTWATYTTLIKIETLWNLLHKGFDVSRVDPDRFDKPNSVKYYEEQTNLITTDDNSENFKLDEENVGQFILWRTDQQRDEEASRLRWLRAISFFIGLAIAYLLNIDAIALLGEAFPGVAGFNYMIITGETLHGWKDFLNPDRAITAGIILTGFAAAAGSTFWHDRLDQLQATKKGAETAVDLLKQAQGDVK